MSALPDATPVSYLLLGESRTQALRQKLTACVARWRSQWAAPSAPTSVVELHLHGQTPLLACGGHAGTIRAQKEGAVLLDLLTGTDVLASLVGLSALDCGAPLLQPAEHRELSEELRVEILRSLTTTILEEAGVAGARVDSTPATLVDVARRSAAERRVCVSIGFAKPAAQLLLFIATSLVERLAPLRKSAGGELVARPHTAIEAQPVYVEALIGHSLVTLRELAALAPGDVVILEHGLAQSGSLAIRGEVFAEMTLGRSADKRAVTVSKTFHC